MKTLDHCMDLICLIGACISVAVGREAFAACLIAMSIKFQMDIKDDK